MFEGIKDVGKMMKQAKEMRDQMKKVQDELKTISVSGVAMGGKIEVVMSGELDVVKVTIDPSFLDPRQADLLCKAIKEATNAAAKKAKDLVTQRLSAVSGGLNLPGM